MAINHDQVHTESKHWQCRCISNTAFLLLMGQINALPDDLKCFSLILTSIHDTRPRFMCKFKMLKIAWVLTAWNLIRFILCNHSTWYKMKTLHWSKQHDQVVWLMSQTYAKRHETVLVEKSPTYIPLQMELKQAQDSRLLIFTVAVTWN